MKNNNFDELLDWGDMNYVPKRTKVYFLENGYVPSDEYEANAFILSKAQVDLDRKIDVSFMDNKKLENVTIDKSCYHLGFYPKIWQRLSVEDKVFVVYYAYKELKNEFGIKKLNFRLVSPDLSKFGIGAYESNFNDLCINFDRLLSKSAYNGLILYDSIAHELNHARQDLIRQYVIKHGAESAESNYEKNLVFPSHQIDFDFQANRFIDDEHQKRLEESKKKEDWNGFVASFYFGSLREISSGNVQVKYFKRIADQTYACFKKDYRNDKKLMEVFQKEKDAYSMDTTNLYFANCTEMVNNISVLLGEYKPSFEANLKNIKRIDKLIADLDELYKSKFVEWLASNKTGTTNSITQLSSITSEKSKLKDKRNKLIKAIRNLAYKQKMCYEALIDLFYFDKKPENFDERIYADIDYYINQKKKNYDMVGKLKNL